MKWVTPFSMSYVAFHSVRMPMSPQWPTVSAECEHFILTEHFKARTKASKSGWIVALYQGEPLREQAPCGLGSRYNVTLQRHSPLPMANAVHDLCIARRRFLWTGRWKGLWTARHIAF
jgi:hypothetical protein